MNGIKYLLKFGKKNHIEEFVKGSLYCSNAKTFWGIEENQKIKGQGDILEAGSKVFAQRVEMQSNSDGDTIIFDGRSNILLHFEPAANIPVFCLFSVYDDDCIIDKSGKYVINISKKKQEIIRKHFPNADTVAIISDPNEFIEDIASSIGCSVKYDQVHYFNIDKGLPISNSSNTAMDHEYALYIMQDTPPIKVNGGKMYTLKAEYIYRVLFCKDVYFMDEQEFRIVLPNETITKGRHYPVKIQENIEIMSIENFFKSINDNNF